MNRQGGITRVGGVSAGRAGDHSYILIGLTVLSVSVIVDTLALMGRLASAYGILIPCLACIAGTLAALAPRGLLTLLFATAPLFWALGDTSVLNGEGAQVNLPMLIGFVVIVGFSHLLLVKDSDQEIELIRKLVLGMGLACVPAIFSAESFFTGAGAYLRIMCPYVVMFAVLHHVRDRADLLHYAKSMAYALLAVAAVLAIAYWRSELWVDFGGYSRLGALYFQTQGFGVLMSVLVFVIVLNFLLTRNRLYLFPLPFALLVLYLTYVRTAWAGGIVLLILLAYQINKSFGRRLLLMALMVGLLFFSAVQQGFLRYRTTVSSVEGVDEILSGRLLTDAVAIDTYRDAPLFNRIFGIGFFRSKEVMGELLPTGGFIVHDDYLATFIEAGVFASVFFVAILIVLLRRSYRGRRYARERTPYEMCGAAFVLILAVLVMGIPGAFYTEVLINMYVYGTMGLMLSQSRFLTSLTVERKMDFEPSAA